MSVGVQITIVSVVRIKHGCQDSTEITVAVRRGE